MKRHAAVTPIIPQANDVEQVIAAAAAVADGAATQSEIASALHVSQRHSHYYSTAAEALGLIEHHQRTWRVSSAGRDLLADRRRERIADLIEAQPYVATYLKSGEAGLRAEWEHSASPSTLRRRLSCVRSWALWCQKVRAATAPPPRRRPQEPVAMIVCCPGCGTRLSLAWEQPG